MSKVLIVEDEEAIADIEKDYLELSGFEVTICKDGTSGLAEALDGEYDICILDVMLPGIKVILQSITHPAFPSCTNALLKFINPLSGYWLIYYSIIVHFSSICTISTVSKRPFLSK